MSDALSASQVEAIATEDRTHSSHSETCEETGRRLFRAGEYVAPGEYTDIDTRRCVTLAAPDFLPGRLDGRVTCYRVKERRWEEISTQPTV